jgi:hypothetical protein
MNVRKNVWVFATIAKRRSDEHIADEHDRCHAGIQKKAAFGTRSIEPSALNDRSTRSKRSANIEPQGQLFSPNQVMHSQSRLVAECARISFTDSPKKLGLIPKQYRLTDMPERRVKPADGVEHRFADEHIAPY